MRAIPGVQPVFAQLLDVRPGDQPILPEDVDPVPICLNLETQRLGTEKRSRKRLEHTELYRMYSRELAELYVRRMYSREQELFPENSELEFRMYSRELAERDAELEFTAHLFIISCF